MFGQLKTGTRLGLSFGAIVLLLLIVVLVGKLQIQAINHHVAEIVDDRAVKMALAADIDDAANDQSRALRNALITIDDPQSVRSHLEVVEKVRAENTAALAKLRPLINNPEAERMFKEMEATRARFGKALDEVVALIREGKREEATRHLMKVMQPAQARYFDAVETFAEAQRKLMVEGGESAKAEGAAAVRISLALAAVAVLLAAGIGVGMTRSLMRQLGGEPAEAQAVATAIAAGDLAHAIRVAPGDRNSVMARLAAMQQSLQQVVAEVRRNAESVATASAQIAQGNQDLSQRTEQQASALQQSAATMEELNATSRNNTDSAQQANQLAQGASAVAAQGGEVVGQVVATMQGISDSSRRIGDIIGVIDGIAFQTNILALNAAVEAARAGEQGRGFAVVAGEVRTLAQRSAEAAKEIKSLIGRSVEQVEQGTVLVDQAGKTMGEIVGSIQRVSDIVAEITSASVQQSAGIQQVGDAMGQMDQVTQQNAALVEQSAAAAISLQGQADQLVQAVSVFKLASAGPLAAAAPAARSSRTKPPAPPARTGSPPTKAAAPAAGSPAPSAGASAGSAGGAASASSPGSAQATKADAEEWTSF